MPDDDALQIMKAAWKSSPFLGQRMLHAHIGERPVIIRELRPQDLKVKIAALPAIRLSRRRIFLAEIVGKAHGRRAAYFGSPTFE